MIEEILDLENQIVQVEKLTELDLDNLIKIKKEVQLISNKTPVFYIVKSSKKLDLKEGEPKVTGFDSLWAHINIAITRKEKELLR